MKSHGSAGSDGWVSGSVVYGDIDMILAHEGNCCLGLTSYRLRDNVVLSRVFHCAAARG